MGSHTSFGVTKTVKRDGGRRSFRCSHARLLVVLALALASALASVSDAAATTRQASSYPMFEELQYGPWADNVANVYPSEVPNSPIVVLVHGGGWRKQGALIQFELESRALQMQGFTVYEIHYRQDSPWTPAFPMEPNDVEAATRWAIATAGSYNGNPSDVTLLGGSAGGHLVALAAEQLDAVNPGTVENVVTLSGPTDFSSLRPLIESSSYTNENFKLSVHRALGWEEASAFPGEFAKQWSPALHPLAAAACPNWLIFNSSEEFIPLSQAEELRGNLARASCNARLIVVPGNEHAFMYFHTVKPLIFEFIRNS